jgi:hypothetical protein
MQIIIGVLNFLLLVYVLLGSKIKIWLQWLFPGKIIVQINEKKFPLNCLERDLRVIEELRLIEMESTTIRSRSEGGRFYLNALVRTRDISKEMWDMFYKRIAIKFIDSGGADFDVEIIHLSKDGFKTHLTLVGREMLQDGKVPEGSVLDIKGVFGEDYWIKMVEQAMLGLQRSGWDHIYREKILPAKKRFDQL